MRKTALIFGGANTLEADKAAALALFDPDVIIGCNHGARDEPGRVDHFCTMHPELFPKWIAERAARGAPPAGKLWHAKHRQSPVESTPIESWGGSSGLLCVRVAFELGCTHIVLAGIPLQKIYNHYDDHRMWMEARQYWPAWERHQPEMQGRVKSMSGWTKNLLGGAPTKEWLNG